MTFERLIAEYERVSSQKYSDDLKISTLMAGLPEDIRRYLQLQVSETTTYEKLRETMLAFERTSSSWSTERVLKAIGADEPTPMDVDRVEWKGKGKGKKGKENGKKGYKGNDGFVPKGKGKGKGKKGKEKGKKGDKGKGGFQGSQGRGKGKGQSGGGKGGLRECWNCGRTGHLSHECRQPRRAQQVQEGDQASTAASTTRTVPSSASTTTPSAKSQVRRIYEYDLTENESDWWTAEGEYGEGEYEVRRLNELDCSDCPSEEAPQPESPAHARESDEAHDFDVFSRDESFSADFNRSDLRVNMWDDPDGHVSECACLSDGCSSDCSHDELRSTSSLWYDMESSEKASDCESYVSCDDESTPRLYCRAVIEEMPSGPEKVEVILDSGADCTVLPMSYRAVGNMDPHASKSVLLDAQGNKIEGGESRVCVNFEIDTPEEDHVISFKDSVVLGNVQQPLFCLGKLMKRGWIPVCDEHDLWYMQKGEASFPVHWSRNSLATYMRLSRLEEAVDPGVPERRDHRAEEAIPVTGVQAESSSEFAAVRMVVDIGSDMALHAETPGWSLSESMLPVHLALNVSTTIDPSARFNPDEWPHRSTLIWKRGREYEVFECGEFWEVNGVKDLDGPAEKLLTILTKNPIEPSQLGTITHDDRAWMPGPNPALGNEGEGREKGHMVVERQDDRPEGPMLGPRAVEVDGPVQEVVVVNDVRLTQESSLRELRVACRFLGISKNGAKATVWNRLKREAKLKVAVEASEIVKAEYAREPLVAALPERPSEELVLIHEATRIPKAPWCEACIASRSREDNYDDSEPHREFPVVSLDYMFTAAQDNPLATHLILVDSQTKFVQATAVDGKGGRSLKSCVEDVVRLMNTLGYPRIGLRYDTEPAMKQIAAAVVATRLKMGLATEEEPIPPGDATHRANRSERYIHTVRTLGNCLLQTILQHTGHKVESEDPLFAWAYRHAAFLISRFSVMKDGCTAFELVHGRSYKSKLLPFGAHVYAQYLPKSKVKGECWKPCVWLGRTSLGDLNIVGDAEGTHHARSVRLAPGKFSAETLKTMKGVPWDPLLDVLPSRKRKAVTGSRLPVLLEDSVVPPSPQDEAASDPPSPEAIGPGPPDGPPVEGGIGSDESMSVSLPGESVDGSHHSEELLMDVDGHPVFPHVNAVSLEEEMPTGHEDNEGYMEADEDPLASGFDVDWTIDDGEGDDVPTEASTDLPFVKSWANRKYEEGPPVLHPDQLRKLDEAMDQVELNRLVAMGVLRPMTKEENLEGMTNLQSKYVRDWRFRPSEDGKTWSWVRRSRLVHRPSHGAPVRAWFSCMPPEAVRWIGLFMS